LAGPWVQQADPSGVPLHLHAPADPAGWCAIVGGLDFHAAIQIYRALPVLVIAEGSHRQGQQRRFFFGKHGWYGAHIFSPFS
jgi:hypothetical protein